MNIWITSDQHFGHANILKFCDRGFDNIEEHDEQLIEEWNKVVKFPDVVYHLGDFTLGDLKVFTRVIRRLSGKIKIVPGGHDWRWLDQIEEDWDIASKDAWIDILPPLYTLSLSRKKQRPEVFVLCHYAMKVWDRSHFNSSNLFGHSHSMLTGDGKQMDVGIDNAHKLYGAYRPISLDEVRAYLLDRPDNFNYIRQ